MADLSLNIFLETSPFFYKTENSLLDDAEFEHAVGRAQAPDGIGDRIAEKPEKFPFAEVQALVDQYVPIKIIIHPDAVRVFFLADGEGSCRISLMADFARADEIGGAIVSNEPHGVF